MAQLKKELERRGIDAQQLKDNMKSQDKLMLDMTDKVCMYVCIYTYMYIYMCYIHDQQGVCVYMYLYTYVYVYTCIYIYTHIYIYKCIYIDIYILDIYICIYMYVRTHSYVNTICPFTCIQNMTTSDQDNFMLEINNKVYIYMHV